MKRGQLSVILIIGVIIILTTGLFVIHNNQARKQGLESTAKGSMTFQSDVLRAFMGGCIDEGIDLAKEEIGISEDTIYQFQDVMEGSVRSCLLNLVSELEIQGWEFEIGEIESEVEISELNVVVKIMYPITGTKRDDTVHFESATRNLYRQAVANLANGVATEDIVLTTPDEDAAITILEGTQAALNGEPVDRITVRILDRNDLGLSNPVTVGETMLEIGPEGVTFSQPIAIRFRFTEDQVLNDDWRDRSRVAWLNPNTNVWYAQPTMVNCDNGRCTAESFTMHASRWTVVSGVCKSDCKSDESAFGRLILSPYESGPEEDSSLDYELEAGFMLNEKYFYGEPYDGTDFDTETYPDMIALPVEISGDWVCRTFLGDESTEESIVEAVECDGGAIIPSYELIEPNHVPDRELSGEDGSTMTFEGKGYDFETIERKEECLAEDGQPMVPVKYFSARPVKTLNPHFKCCMWCEDTNGSIEYKYEVYDSAWGCPVGDCGNGGPVSAYDSNCGGPGFSKPWYWDTEMIGDLTLDNALAGGVLEINVLTLCMNNNPDKLDDCMDAFIKQGNVEYVEEDFKGFITPECAGGTISGLLTSVKYTNDGSACLDTDFIRGLDIEDIQDMNLVIESTCGAVASSEQCVNLVNALGTEGDDILSAINLLATGVDCSDSCDIKVGFAERHEEGAVNLYADITEITINNDPGSVYDDTQDLLTSFKDIKLVLNGNSNAAMRICFPAGTKIATPDGDINIEEIRLGQPVYTYNITSGKVEINPVVKTYTRESKKIVTVETDNDIIKATPDHPFWNGHEFVPIEKFEVGEHLFKLSEGVLNEETIKSITVDYSKIPVYNLKVADNFNYFAYGYLNHNSGYGDIVAVDMMAPTEYCQQDICACGTSSGEAQFVERGEVCEIDPTERFMQNDDGTWSYYICDMKLECDWIDMPSGVMGGEMYEPVIIDMLTTNPFLLNVGMIYETAIAYGYTGDPADMEAFISWWSTLDDSGKNALASSQFQLMSSMGSTQLIQFLLNTDPTINSVELLAYTKAFDSGEIIFDEEFLETLMDDAERCLDSEWPNCADEWMELIVGGTIVIGGGIMIAPAALELFNAASIWAYVNIPMAAGAAGSTAVSWLSNTGVGKWLAQNMQNPMVQRFMNSPITARIASLAASGGISFMSAWGAYQGGIPLDFTFNPVTMEFMMSFFGPMMDNLLYGASLDAANEMAAFINEGGNILDKADDLQAFFRVYGDDAINMLKSNCPFDDVLAALNNAGMELSPYQYIRLAGNDYDSLMSLVDKGIISPDQVIRTTSYDLLAQWVNEGKFSIDDILDARIDPRLLPGYENIQFSTGTSSHIVENIDYFIEDLTTLAGLDISEIAQNPALFETYAQTLMDDFGYSAEQVDQLRTIFNSGVGSGKFKVVIQLDENTVLKIYKNPIRDPASFSNPAAMDEYYTNIYNDFIMNPGTAGNIWEGEIPPDVQEAINYFQYVTAEDTPYINMDMANRGVPFDYIAESQPVVVNGKLVATTEPAFEATLADELAAGNTPSPRSVALSVQMYKDSSVYGGHGDLVFAGSLRADNLRVVTVTEDFLYHASDGVVYEVYAGDTILVPFDRGGALRPSSITSPNFITAETESFEDALWDIFVD